MKMTRARWFGVVLVLSIGFVGLICASAADDTLLSKKEMMAIQGGLDFDCSDCQSNGDCAGRNGHSESYLCGFGTAGEDCYDCTLGGDDKTCDTDGGIFGFQCEVLDSEACGDLEKGTCSRVNGVFGCYYKSPAGTCSNPARKCKN